VITRAYLHVAGPPAAGKTAFIEAMLRRIDELVLVARGVRDETLDEALESAPHDDPELSRYVEAGASGAARFAFPAGPEAYDDFFVSDLMSDYSEAVVIEGDTPIRHVDLDVFVAPPLPRGKDLFVRVRRDRAKARASARAMERLLREPGGPEQVLEQMLGSSFAEIARLHPAAVDTFRETLLDGIARTRKASRTDTSERWGIAPSHAGIERARLVVVNVRHERERERGERLVADLARLRKDDALFEDILGIRGTRTPITAVVANVNDPADPGLKKAIARVKRAIRRVALD